MTLLKVENLSVNYGSIRAVREISFEVNQGEIVTLIGSNGAGKTTLLMLDEPSMGLAPLIVKEIFSLIRRIREEMGTTVLLVEQNARMALKISDRAYVLQTGKITLEGSSKELLQSEEVQKAYLGM